MDPEVLRESWKLEQQRGAGDARRTPKLLLIAALGALALAGCGTSAAGPSAAAAPTPQPSVKIGVVSNPQFGGILVDGGGHTLYYFTPEKDGHVACTGTCAQTWSPLVLTAGERPVLTAALPGNLGSVMRPEGQTQVTYNEFPLYTFTGDAKAGDTNGEGLLGQWFVVPESFPQDADGDADGTAQPAAPSAAPSPGAAAEPRPAPTCNFAQPTFNDGDSDNAGGRSDGDGCG